MIGGGGARMGCGQVLNCLDLYCGAGGLAFLEEGGGDEVDIVPRWAVDYNPSACFSFQANYPKSQVSSTSCSPRPFPSPERLPASPGFSCVSVQRHAAWIFYCMDCSSRLVNHVTLTICHQNCDHLQTNC